ncbi:hypothetical protein D3C80_1701700 [compost metagenome]
MLLRAKAGLNPERINAGYIPDNNVTSTETISRKPIFVTVNSFTSVGNLMICARYGSEVHAKTPASTIEKNTISAVSPII